MVKKFSVRLNLVSLDVTIQKKVVGEYSQLSLWRKRSGRRLVYVIARVRNSGV